MDGTEIKVWSINFVMLPDFLEKLSPRLYRQPPDQYSSQAEDSPLFN